MCKECLCYKYSVLEGNYCRLHETKVSLEDRCSYYVQA